MLKTFMREEKKSLKDLKTKYFHFILMNCMSIKWKKKKNKKKQDTKLFNPHEVIEWIINKEDAHVNNEVFEKYFKLQKPGLMYKVLLRTNDKKKSTELVNLFNSALKYFKEEIKNMPKEEIENENPDEIVRVVEMILDFNKQQQQSGKSLKY